MRQLFIFLSLFFLTFGNSFADLAPLPDDGLPDNASFFTANKAFMLPTYDGLMINTGSSSAQANIANNGQFNSVTNTSNQAVICVGSYDNTALSGLSSISFRAKNHNDATSPMGKMYWNIHVNFNWTGTQSATEFGTLVEDDILRNRIKNYNLSSYFETYTTLSTERKWRVGSGTGVLSGYANSDTGSNIITNVSNCDQLTLGMYFRQIPAATSGVDSALTNIPDGAKITAIDLSNCSVTLDQNVGTGSAASSTGNVNTTSGSATVTQVTTTGWAVNQTVSGAGIPPGTYITVVTGTSTLTLSNAATATATGVTLTRRAGFNYVQYGGKPPVDRVGTADGSATITGITNTKDLQVGMLVTGAGVQANSLIASIVANTSITLDKTVTAGTPTLSFRAVGLTGIPGSGASNLGITLADILANNPDAKIVPAGATQGVIFNTPMPGVCINQGGVSGEVRNFLKQMTINSSVYNF